MDFVQIRWNKVSDLTDPNANRDNGVRYVVDSELDLVSFIVFDEFPDFQEVEPVMDYGGGFFDDEYGDY